MFRVVALTLAFAAAASGQLPRPFYAWWSSPGVVQDLNLTNEQKTQIRLTVRDYRGHLLQLRGEIERNEAELEFQFNQQPVDVRRASEVIDRLASARSDLTRTISQMSLKLRTVLTQQQWQELQKRRPAKGRVETPGEEPGGKR